MREEDAVYVVEFRFRLKRAEEKEDQGRGRREWSVFRERARRRCYFSSMAGAGRVYGRKVRLQAWKRADGKERAQKRYLAAQVPLTFQLARVWWRRGLSVHVQDDDRRMM